ncbi:MAG: deoxyribonuclease IV [Nonomuraea sp.]|uniref:deoxyribonuclease IV n=1 Tax=Hamadaea sp. TaxID=2024425 RepID=UPI001838CA96|nr:deoxyribonuclease IV [Hamadaea sp.]NUP76972.1 deoxyribonuclease IV [Nonomuraea sp.]NUR73797.1 deoxyribonuclease IV [Hamadaea sp.]NUT22409.1 deoxyribonuclease IV [Hamadaea sp.]
MLGVHSNSAGGLAKSALAYVDQVGAGSVQVYIGNARSWRQSAGDPIQDGLFLSGCADRGIPSFIHAPLLVNLGSPTPATVTQSEAAISHALIRGKAIGARGVVFHAGSSVDPSHTDQAWKQVREALLPLLDRSSAEGWPRLLVEPSAGGGRSLAARVEHLAEYFAAVDHHPALGVCFDTCHAWAAGHDLAAPGGMTATLDALVAAVGPGRLELVHANDSKDPLGSTRDRHEAIGQGMIGLEPFRELLAHPAAAGLPVIVETPGETHTADLAALRSVSPHLA